MLTFYSCVECDKIRFERMHCFQSYTDGFKREQYIRHNNFPNFFPHVSKNNKIKTIEKLSKLSFTKKLFYIYI